MDVRKDRLFFKRLVILTVVTALCLSGFSVIPTVATDNDFFVAEEIIDEKISNPTVFVLKKLVIQQFLF